MLPADRHCGAARRAGSYLALSAQDGGAAPRAPR
jgi:hypothetical protein